MIHIDEMVRNPGEFLMQNPGIVNEIVANHVPEQYIGAAGIALVSSRDFDMEVAVYDRGRSIHVENEFNPKDVCRVLGSLYQQSFQSIHTEDYRVSVLAFPSPAVVNNLIRALGMNPGDDAFKVTHAAWRDGAKIPPKTYVKHLKRGEYPISSDVTKDHILFEHDRKDAHMPGVILAPPEVVLATKNAAREADRLRPSRGSQRGRITGQVDHATMSLRRFVQCYGKYPNKGFALSEWSDSLNAGVVTSLLYGTYTPDLFDATGEVLLGHMLKVGPRIIELQQKRYSEQIPLADLVLPYAA